MQASLILLPLWFAAACALIRESGDAVGSLSELSPSCLRRHQDIAAWPARLEGTTEDIENVQSGVQRLPPKRKVQQRDQAQDSISNSERPATGVDGLLVPCNLKRVRHVQDHSPSWPVFSKDDFWQNLLTQPASQEQWAHFSPRVLSGDEFRLGEIFNQLDAHEQLVPTSQPDGSALGARPPGVVDAELGSHCGDSPQPLQHSPGLVRKACADIMGASSLRKSNEVPSISTFSSNVLSHTSARSKVDSNTHSHDQGLPAGVRPPSGENSVALPGVSTPVPSWTHFPEEDENPEISTSPDRSISPKSKSQPSERWYFQRAPFHLFSSTEPLSDWNRQLLKAFPTEIIANREKNYFITIPERQAVEDLELLQEDLLKQDGLPYSKRFFFGVAYDDTSTSGYRTGTATESPLQRIIEDHFSTNAEGFWYLEEKNAANFFRALSDGKNEIIFKPFKGKVKPGGLLGVRDGFSGTLARKLMNEKFWRIINGSHSNQKWEELLHVLEDHATKLPRYIKSWMAYQRKVAAVIQARQVFGAYSTLINKLIVDDNFESDKQQILSRKKHALDYFDKLWYDSQCGPSGELLLNVDSLSAGDSDSALNFKERKKALGRVSNWLNSEKRAERMISMVLVILKLWLAKYRSNIFKDSVKRKGNPVCVFLNRIMCYVFDVAEPTPDTNKGLA